ncbi:MAG TPA: response regulator [Nannocystaceae bacterium]|nr:response regulator [Nannocystaceae bacterium]
MAAVLALFTLAGLSYRSLQQRTEGARQVDDARQVAQDLERLVSTLKDAETGQRGYLLTDDERYLAPYDAARLEVPQRLAALRKLLAEVPARAETLAVLDATVIEKLTELAETIELQRAGQREAALALVYRDRGKVAMDRIRTLADDLQAATAAELAERIRTWEDAVGVSTAILTIGSLLLLVLVVGAAVLSSRDFHAQQLESWLRTGQNDLAERMQGEQSLAQLGDAIVAYVAEYVGAPVGALHFVPASDELKRLGSYGIDAPADDESRPVALGLTREALARDRPLVVEDVPPDFFPVRTATGRTQPRHVLIAPVTADGKPNGVLELGLLHPVAPEVIELLQRVADPIGTALRSAVYRRELVDLLEETTRQAEELQTQQEELRVNNEELEQQSQALQASRARLENQQVELEQINSQLEEQMQTLEAQRDDLSRAQTELVRTSAFKSEFLANMSHELRTPLNSSLILAKLLAANERGNLDEEQVHFAETIYKSGNDLLALINDVLDLSKIEAGQLDVRPEPIVIARQLDDLRTMFEPIAREKKLALELEIAAGTPTGLDTDPVRLQQILKNLVSNALKFTEQGGVTVRVRAAASGGAMFEVTDTGIGIPADRQAVIFEAFRQADGTVSRRFGGTGLGLSISRDLAGLLGGTLSVASTPGRGSTFTLIVPAKAPVAAPRRPRAPTPPIVRRPAPSPAPAATTASARTILVIEDDVDFANVLAELARELDFTPVLAHTAEDGLAIARRNRPSGIVLDVGLPDRSGLSVLDMLKHDPQTRHIPVHICAATDYSQTALAMGAAGYAIKPVEREQLLAALRVLETKSTQRLRRVLVVEDDDVQRDATSRLLAADDVETVAVPTAKAALEHLRSSTFDCMVLDLTLPDGSGIELLEEMSAHEQYGFPPVIVYTGRSLSRDEEQQLRRFSQSIIIKGARSPERLLDEVALFLHQVEAELPPERQRMLRDARFREAVFEGRRILVVEDDVRNIFALTKVLEPRGATIEVARNGREALTHLEQKPGIDLVLMDLMMPEMDGLAATREIRKRPALARLPIIALTAKAMADDREAALAAGANDYIAKPLDVDRLLSLVRVWMPR